MNRRVTFACEVKPKRRSRRETESEQGVQYVCVDPKPDDLPLARLKEE